MKHLLLPIAALASSACSTTQSPIPKGAAAKDHGKIGAGEGPAWKDGALYFTDGQHINRLDPDGKTRVFRGPATSGNANGLMFDRQGRLVACESGKRRVTRTEKDGRVTVLADRLEGHRKSSPKLPPIPQFPAPTNAIPSRYYASQPGYHEVNTLPLSQVQLRHLLPKSVKKATNVNTPAPPQYRHLLVITKLVHLS